MPCCRYISFETRHPRPDTPTNNGQVATERRLQDTYAAHTIKVSGDIVLIKVDLTVNDTPFEAWLDGIGPLDAGALWFSRVQKTRAATKVAKDRRAENDTDLRVALEERVMELARRRVRPRGFVQLVSRVAGDAEHLRNEQEIQMPRASADFLPI